MAGYGEVSEWHGSIEEGFLAALGMTGFGYWRHWQWVD